MKKSRLMGAVCASLLLPLASIANAITTYQYAGNNYSGVSDATPPDGAYDTSMSVSGSFAVSSPLLPSSLFDLQSIVQTYSFFDGRSTLTESDSRISSFSVTTDEAGHITEWSIVVGTPLGHSPRPAHLFERRRMRSILR